MGTKPAVVYEDFAPVWKRHTEEEKDIIKIDLKGFNKEQLKVTVQAKKKGVLVVHGEREVDAYKISRFTKDFDLPEDCNTREIRARLSHGVLSIVMPKPKQTQMLDLKEEDSIWVVKISKKKAIRVAVFIVVAVTLVAIGTQIAKLVHRQPHEAHH